MSTPINPDEAAWLDARLEAHLDGALGPEETREAARLLALHPPAQEALAEAAAIRDALGRIPAYACPDHVTEAVFRRVRQEEAARRPWLLSRQAERPGPSWFAEWLGPALRPVAAAAALSALVLASALVQPGARPVDPQLAEATREAQWAIAYLSEVGRKTGHTVRQDVLAERVVAPMQHAVEAALPAPVKD